MTIQLIGRQFRLIPTLRCHLCGSTKDLYRNEEIACMDCLFVWYDQGLTDPSEIRAASLQRQGRTA